jgi:hypothetical protein
VFIVKRSQRELIIYLEREKTIGAKIKIALKQREKNI